MRSYIAGNIKIQQFAAVLLPLGLVLGGCSQFSVPVGSNNVDTPTLLTGSIPSSSDVAYSDISVEDRKIIAENLDVAGPQLAETGQADALSLPWLNAVSGNSGTLTNIDSASLGETGCVFFKTTANTIAGIKLYSGTACRDVTQKFSVTTLSVADA
ncbi:RT0821/Lpp0805 family surface protein [Roseibium salinum]|uniref:RT0821/Lpp0805 family surface protein n=1 Tax=Roseibium salinum TaxID=1604349 RepID=A0ABT3R356_9HYPH|nr:RT0821/Lpp0805 family surface protein [Roseibium sp. DSM 29163]MCX2723687.1 RT0821/Lpp0805 family surface protein [Roseibium sp. DSM 29163]